VLHETGDVLILEFSGACVFSIDAWWYFSRLGYSVV